MEVKGVHLNCPFVNYSNIHQFCGYIKQLPSLEEKVKKTKRIYSRKAKIEDEDV